ncbi:MAG: EpsG family protein [Treponema sp.]|nr:EpsG family protein [Treponema sp.]
MNVTFVGFAIIFLFMVLSSLYNKPYSKNFSIFIFLTAIVFVFLTYKGLHSDWVVYRAYMTQAIVPGRTHFEKGFDLLLFLANKFSCFEIIPLVALFLFYTLLNYIKDDALGISENFIFLVFSSFFFAFIPLYLGALRQAIASCFLFFLFFSIKKEVEFWKSLCFLILSILFHKSSVLILLMTFVFYFFTRYKNNEIKPIISVVILVCIALFVFTKYILNNLLISMGLWYRVGNSFDFTSSPIKDLFILGERFVFLFSAFIFYNRTENEKIHNMFCRLEIVGSCFFIVLYSLMRNVAGRTLAFYRFVDLYILYFFLDFFLKKIFGKKINDETILFNGFSMFLCLIYSLLKYFITVANSGVF